MKCFESFNCLYYHGMKFLSKIKRFVEVFWKFELPLSSRAKHWQIYGRFYEVTWKFGLPLLSPAETFAKIKQFSWCDLNIWPSPFPSGNFRRNKADLLKRFGNLNCAYYRGLKFSQKWGSFDGITWNFELPLLGAEIFAKISNI